MVGNLQTCMFLLYTFVLPVNPIVSVMAIVNDCPKNEHEVIQASQRLECGNDTYGNNQYLCLPNKEKTSLVEFCFPGVMRFMEKGNCIEFSEGKYIYQSCKHFLNGCPEKDLGVSEIYRYPACQNINTHLKCYVMDRNCTTQSETAEPSGQNNVILITCISIGGVILFIIICCIIIIFKRRRAIRNKKKGDTDVSSGETLTFLSERNKESTNLEIVNSKPGKGDQERVIDRTAPPVVERNKESTNLEIVNSKPGKGDQERVIDRTAPPVVGIASWKDNEIRLVLIGKTGSGKSTTGNSILGEKRFKVLVSGSSVTRVCAQKSTVRFGRKILVVDTPGIFDTTQSNNYIQKEIMKCISISSPGPHAFILVLPVTRYTEEDQKSVQHFEDAFGENIFKYLIVLFTRKDDLDEEGKSFIHHVKNVPLNLRALIEKCGGRIIAFNNRLKGEESDNQVKELLSMIYTNVEKNNGECYRNEMYREAEKALQNREAEIRKQAELKREKDIQKMRKEIFEEYAIGEIKNILKNEEFEERKKEIEKRQEEKLKDAERNTQIKYEEIVRMTREIAREEVEKGKEKSVLDTVWDSAKLIIPEIFSKLK